MRRDVFIENDSGGLSVVTMDAVDAIIADGRADDLRFVREFQALLLELYGDDSMPVRLVVDEPLTADEEAQWLARASWQLDTRDGRLLVMGGFDPDVLGWWRDATGGNDDGQGVAVFAPGPGRWQVDVYAHVGSMNGRAVLDEADERPGAAFRRHHPGRPFPLWLARHLQFSGEADPGFESLWRDVKAGIAAGELAVDVDGPAAVGFLVHVTPAREAAGEPPPYAWFDSDSGRRLPAVFPAGLAAGVPDPGLESFRDDLLERRKPAPERPLATHVVEIIQCWDGDTLKRIPGGPVGLPLAELYFLHWLAALGADSPPRFELWVEPRGTWSPPSPTADMAVAAKGGGVTALGPVANTGGWHTWWTARSVTAALGDIPDGSTLDLAMAPRLDLQEDADPAVGRALYSGTVADGQFHIAEASPVVPAEVLAEALQFVRDLVRHERLHVRAGAEAEAFAACAAVMCPGPDEVRRNGEIITLAEPDERLLLILAAPVFRVRFAGAWPMDAADD